MVLDEVQQLDGVGHPQEQRPQPRDQLVHAEDLEDSWLPIPTSPERTNRTFQASVTLALALLEWWSVLQLWLHGGQLFGLLLEEGEQKLLPWDQRDLGVGAYPCDLLDLAADAQQQLPEVVQLEGGG